MKYDGIWERLLEYLEEWADVREVAGGLEITFEEPEGHSRIVEVVMGAADWDDFITTIHGHGDPARTGFKETVLAVPEGVRYLVYESYDWTPSRTPELAVDDDPGPGEWVVTDGEGDVVSRFSDFDDQS